MSKKNNICDELYKRAIEIATNPSDNSLKNDFKRFLKSDSIKATALTLGLWKKDSPLPTFKQVLLHKEKEIKKAAIDKEYEHLYNSKNVQVVNQYATENGLDVDLSMLTADRMSLESYQEAHKGLPLLCHDIMIAYDDGLLLVNRDNVPAKGVLWPIGGRIERGLSVEESIRKKTKEECGLSLRERLVDLGWKRTLFQTGPFNHGKGTDTVNIRIFGRGFGNIKLDGLHTEPTIIKPEDYTTDFRKTLDPYVQDFMDLAMQLR